jgi:hypothetical protein
LLLPVLQALDAKHRRRVALEGSREKLVSGQSRNDPTSKQIQLSGLSRFLTRHLIIEDSPASDRLGNRAFMRYRRIEVREWLAPLFHFTSQSVTSAP